MTNKIRPDLSVLIKQYADDLRRNASGGDDYPFDFAKGVADYLEELIKRSSDAAQPSAGIATPISRDKLWHLIARHIACEADCQKRPNGCGCAQNAADEIVSMLSVAQPSAGRGVLPEWEDTRVQTVYNILCDDKLNTPPNPEEHWEGWVSRNIVAALQPSSAGSVTHRKTLDEFKDFLTDLADLTTDEPVERALLAAREYAAEDNNPKSNRVLGLIRDALEGISPVAQTSPPIGWGGHLPGKIEP